MATCSYCDGPVEEGWRSCPACGATDPADRAKAKAGSRTKGPDEQFCFGCGQLVKRLAELCPHCGVRLRAAPAAAAQPRPPEPRRKPKRNPLSLVLILAALVFGFPLVMGIGVALLNVASGGKLLEKHPVTFVVSPEDAQVVIYRHDSAYDQGRGYGPETTIDLYDGRYYVQVAAAGYRDKKRDFRVPADTRVEVTLEKE